MNRPILCIVCGLPGVGKSTVATALGEHVDGVRYRSDEVRNGLVDPPRYTPEETRRVYLKILSKAYRTLLSGANVVLDATFSDRTYRTLAHQLAAFTGADFRTVLVVAQESVVRERIGSREDNVSEADFDVYLEKMRTFDPFPDPDLLIDNSGSLDETFHAVGRWVRTEVTSSR